MLQHVIPLASGESSSLMAAIDASSINANPASVSPLTILRRPRFVCAYARRSAFDDAIANVDRLLGRG